MLCTDIVVILSVWTAHAALNKKWPIAIWEVVLAFNGALLSGISCHLYLALSRVVTQEKKGSRHRRLRSYLRFFLCATLLGLVAAVSQVAAAVGHVNSDEECCTFEQFTIEKVYVDQTVIMATVIISTYSIYKPRREVIAPSVALCVVSTQGDLPTREDFEMTYILTRKAQVITLNTHQSHQS
jgi:hypothetical protein